ncbi:GRB2-associated-binding protein 3 [Protopterus annectens]|uniref:GRB2-associated-binding protein 3 n=1 Tax=Protopterus annectens TaxID=7888 RepID=UPI001CFB7EB7|nr:GRB2-associated-binding protein 3 [Protopterus annectens]
MSMEDIVCTGWLIKSPPEKKLKRFAWRKRWFVLRSGRMSGNPDVLEYYRNNTSKKPIRVINLSECEVRKHSGLNFVKKEFQNNCVFIVKTTYRTFYLVAKTEKEMQTWVDTISQICNFGPLDDGTESVESLSRTNSCLQSSPSVLTQTQRSDDASLPLATSAGDTTITEESTSESESINLPDYLFLSQCETGRMSHCRCDSGSNSDRSLEQISSDEVFLDSFQVQTSCSSLQSSCSGSSQQETFSITSSCAIPTRQEISGSSLDFSSSSPVSLPLQSQVFQFDKGYSLPHFVTATLNSLPDMPPPRPPKPCHLADKKPEEVSHFAIQNGASRSQAVQPVLLPRRISLASMDSDRRWKVDLEGNSLRSRDKRLSLNLPRALTSPYSTPSDSSEDSYVPMNPTISPPSSSSDCTSDGYIPMSPVKPTLTAPSVSTEKQSSPLPALPGDLEPPPVNRNLKPRRRVRPPPLDLRSLSTIREHSIHPVLTRTWTVPYNRTSFYAPEISCPNSAQNFTSSFPGVDDEESYVSMEQNHTSACNGTFPLSRKFNLDYLSLDFNSASPSPVQKKPLLSEEDRVDYVQVDEQKTQALQNTKQEWTDVRQSKV